MTATKSKWSDPSSIIAVAGMSLGIFGAYTTLKSDIGVIETEQLAFKRELEKIDKRETRIEDNIDDRLTRIEEKIDKIRYR